MSWSNTFPDKYPIVSPIVQDVAFALGEHVLFEWILISHHGCLHGASSIGNLESREMIKNLNLSSESFGQWNHLFPGIRFKS